MAAKKKRPPVRRRKSSAASRVVRFWILFIVVLAVLGSAGFGLASWSGFDPKTVAVDGNSATPSSAILERAAIGPNDNIWLLNTRAIARRVEALPYVQSAVVRRGVPNSVTIEVTERVPFAVVQTPAERALVDDGLRVLADDPATSTLPALVLRKAIDLTPGSTLKGAAPVALRDAAQMLAVDRVDVTSLAQDKYDELVITLRGGVRVLMGDDTEFERKVALISPMLDQLQKKERAISEIDLRAPNTPVVVYK